MFAGKKSAQIREILISESAWEEMTCLFAPSLGDHLTFHQPMGGMFLWAKFKYAMDTTQWLQKTIRNGVVFVPGEFFYCEEPDHCTLRMSYVSTTEENLIEAVKRLKISLN
ncbi:transcriptional regulator [Klebsiella pneumoniae]|nr:transcriptional regulator [Klebsiella pneumoniae]SLV27134.1 transcriptional regulator [Klebsiella pneumoniae]SLV27445.1 transcriptional regulator [Klebsiella pneumoniae]SLV45594.1 transcriptional regulator [Klebsiella pneumoniae]SLV47344.1 transcriptional regulator [Klebsiella pneumoniae]